VKIGLITFNIRHLKTQEILNGLISKKKYKIVLILREFKKYKLKKFYINHVWLSYWYGLLCKVEDLECCVEDIF